MGNLTDDEREAIKRYEAKIPLDQIRRPPGSAHDPDSPNFVEKITSWRKTQDRRKARRESAQRLEMRRGLQRGLRVAEIAKEIGITEDSLRARADRLGFKLPAKSGN